MNIFSTFRRFSWSVVASAGVLAGAAAAQPTATLVDIGSSVPDAISVKEGLFPEDACKELEANGFKCMGLKPAIRYSLPASSFKVGSSELPPLLKKQLDVFAGVLGGADVKERKIRLVGHADASGRAEVNQALSIKRAEATRDYLIQKGVNPAVLVIAGVGEREPVNPKDPLAPENRRVEIGRQ